MFLNFYKNIKNMFTSMVQSIQATGLDRALKN